MIDAFVFFGLRSGARPMGILHSIAAGFLDGSGQGRRRADRDRRVVVALPGRLLHRDGLRAGEPCDAGPAQTVADLRTPVRGLTPVMANGILIHVFGVGLPAAYFASRT